MSTFLKRYDVIVCVLIVLVFLSLLLYSNRRDYLTTYNVGYWKDRFEHSQWVLPLSRRLIGDDGLFSYLGYRLVLGDDPTTINAETLPIGKYLIGMSIFYLGNPSYYALFTGLFVLVVFFGLSKKLFKSDFLALGLTTLLLVEPLFFTQLTSAWIDLLQLALLISHWFLLLSALDKTNFRCYVLLLVSGISLGLFTETKLPILLPIILGIDIFIFWKKSRSWQYITTIILGFLTAFFASYTRFFLLGNTLFDLWTVQKYIVSFYLSSQLSAQVSSVWKAIFLGVHQTINGTSNETIREWTPLWSILLINIPVVFLILKRQTFFIACLVFFVLFSLFIFTFIPFYPRYLTLVIPFLYLLVGVTLNKFVKKEYMYIVFALLIALSLVNNWRLLHPNPEIIVNQFFHNMSHQFFQDVYVENLSQQSKTMSQYEFYRLVSLAYKNAEIETTDFSIVETEKISGQLERMILEVTYKTRSLGAFNEQKEIMVVNEDNKWKVIWNWDLVVNGFEPTYSFTKTINPGKRGTIRDANKTILAQDTNGYLISIDLSKVDWARENEMLAVISKYVFQKPVHLQNAYLENPIPGRPVDLATSFVALTAADLQLLQSYPGIMLTPYPVREYHHLDPKSVQNTFYSECCTRIYTSHNYQGINSVESEYNDTLQGSSGGKIVLIDRNGKIIKTVHEIAPLSGKDVIVPN